MATDGQPQIIDGGMQPKPAIFVLSLACIARNRKFASTSLQRQVSELSVPERWRISTPAADALSGTHPLAATLALRAMIDLLRTDRCRARSLSRGSGRNEQECYPSRVLGPRDETKTPGDFGSRLERGGLGGV